MNRRIDPIGYGIIGAGIWGNLHLKTLSGDPRANVVAICDLNEERAKQVASEYNVPYYYTSYDEMLKESRSRSSISYNT